MEKISRKEDSGKYFHIMPQVIAKENIFHDDNSKGYYLLFKLLERFKK
ncbi:MAG: hypothetical protein LBD46_02910 [Endomicrobium sp.]|jgi:hypothetical protein|nr:hypothetical protein [Endomicrobium sp.]